GEPVRATLGGRDLRPRPVTGRCPRMSVPIWVWVVTLAATLTLLLIDVLVIGRRPHVPSAKETGGALAFYVGTALLFGVGVWAFAGGDFAGQYFAGWLTEYSLSIDNLFVFLIIMAKFGVPQKLQQRALMVGVDIDLVLRESCFAVGGAVIIDVSWVELLCVDVLLV